MGQPHSSKAPTKLHRRASVDRIVLRNRRLGTTVGLRLRRRDMMWEHKARQDKRADFPSFCPRLAVQLVRSWLTLVDGETLTAPQTLRDPGNWRQQGGECAVVDLLCPSACVSLKLIFRDSARQVARYFVFPSVLPLHREPPRVSAFSAPPVLAAALISEHCSSCWPSAANVQATRLGLHDHLFGSLRH